MANNIEQRWANINLDNDLQSTPTINNQENTTGLASKIFALENARQDKLNNLTSKPQEPTDPYKVKDLNSYQDVTITGLEDADTAVLADGRKVRLSTPLSRYDAVEIEHPESLWGKVKNTLGIGDVNKSDYATEQQRRQVAMILGKQPAAVTDQDLIDVGNMQQVQMLSDLMRSKGQDRVEAPLVPNVGQVDLNQGLDIKTKLKIDSTDMYGRVVGSLVNPETGIDVVKQHAEDPRLNAFAPEARNYGYVRDAEGRRVDTLDTGGLANELGQTARAGIAGVAKGAVELADVAQELGTLPVQYIRNKLTGENKDIDLINSKAKEEIREGIDKWFGYNAKVDEADLTKVESMLEGTGIKIADPSTWNNITDLETLKTVGQAAVALGMNPSLTAGMITEIVGSGLGAGMTLKIGSKIGSKVAPELVEKTGDILRNNAAKLEGEAKALKASGVTGKELEDGLTTIKDKYSLAMRAEDVVRGTVMFNADMAVRMNQWIDGYKENNNGEDPSASKLLQMGVLARVASSAEVGALKLHFAPSGELAKETSSRVMKLLTVAASRFGKSIPVETVQETFDGIVETIATQEGASKYEGKSLKELLNDESAKILTGTLAGGAGGFHMSTSGFAADMLKSKSIEELTKEVNNQVKTNMNSTLDMEGSVDLGANEAGIESTLGVDSVTRMYNESKSVDEMLAKMMETKRQILNDVYEYDESTDTFKGAKDTSKLEAVEKWFDNYAQFQADKDGNIPKRVQDEVDYIKKINAEFETFESVAANEVKSQVGEVQGRTEEELKADIDTQVDEIIKANGMEEEPGVREDIVARVRKAYELSGLVGLGNGIRLELDKEALTERVKENAGLKSGGLEQRSVNPKDKVVELGTVTNEELASIVDGSGTEFASDHPNTKFRERVIRKLDPTEARSVVNTLRAIAPKIQETIAANESIAGKVFKGGDVRGNMLRLMLTTMNTINGQTASDSQQRRDTESDSSALRGDEYWASYNNSIEQAGKDYVSSHGMKLAGDAKAMAKFHRELGRLGLQLLQDAGLAEVSNDYILSRAGSAVDAEGNGLSTGTIGVTTEIGKDALTGTKVTLVKDKGIKLTDTKDVNGVYKSSIGDAVKRVVKTVLPNAERLPQETYVKEKLKKDPDIEVDKATESIIQERMSKPHIMKTGTIMDVFKYLKGLNESTDGGIGQVKNFKELKRFLLLEEGGSELLKESEQGSTQGKIDNLIGILDNLDTFANPDGVYTTFQVDINNRLTVRESAGNYQSDKVYSRPMLGTGKYEIKTEGRRDMIIASLVDELGSYEDRSLSDLDVLKKYASIYDSILKSSNGNIEELISIIANSTNTGYAFSHMKSMGGIRILSVLQGARDVVDGLKDDGTFGVITTEYIPEKDASASGVFNVTMNFAGRDVEFFKKRLMDLGVEFDGESLETTTDAYKILGNIIQGLIEKAKARPEGIGAGKGEEGILEVSRMNDLLKDEKLLRQLAKYPIMTWFYSAGETSIVENLTQEMTHVLIEKAVEGNENVLKYLSDVMGKEITAENVKEIKKGGKEHRALRNTLKQIGEVYYSKLDDAFPEIRKAKEEMSEYFKFLTKTGKVNNKDYWKGKVRTAVGVLNGTDTTTSIYKWKNQAVNMTSQEKIDSGLATEEEGEFLLTLREKLPNETSMMALMAHMVDAAQAILGQGAVKSDNVIQSKHDGFSGRPEDLQQFQKKAEKVTVEVASKYDFVNEMVWAMEYTADNMRKDLNESMPANERKNLEYSIKDLEAKIAKVKELNAPRMEAKEELLKGAKSKLFGKEGYVTEEKTKVTEEVKTAEVVKEEAVKKVYDDVLDMVSSLDTADPRKSDILANKDNIKFVAVTDKVKAELAKHKNRELNGHVNRGGSFTYNGTVYIGSKAMQGLDQVDSKIATAEQILDTVMHEIEHAIVDKFITNEANGKIEAEYKKIEAILNKALKSKPTGSPRVNARVENVLYFARKGDMQQAVKELVATSREEEVASGVFDELNKRAGIQGGLVERLIKQVWDKVKEFISSKPVAELLKDTDIYSLAIAVKSIQDKARGIESEVKVATKEKSSTINKDKTPFDEDLISGLMKDIKIC